MDGIFYIDGVNSYEYGVSVVWEGYKGIISRPQFKKIDFNDWPEEDGIEADLSEPVLDTRDLNISFACLNAELACDFIVLLSDKGYHDFDFMEIGCKLKLRLVSQPNKDTFFSLEKFTLQFADDFPFQDVVQQPVDLGVSQPEYELDDTPFSAYGVWLTEGADDNIEKSPAVKKNLLVNINNRKGAIYDGQKVVFQSKDVPLKCGIKAPDVETFWRNYNALFHVLIQPGERQFYSDRLGESYPCYYKSMDCNVFDIIRGCVWCEFTLTFVFTCFRVGEALYLLATEDNFVIMTEDGEFFIDVKNYGAKKEKNQ